VSTPEVDVTHREHSRPGRLTVYFGAAPGVGKTYAMLDEAHRRQARATDVVVALVETHGRAAIIAQLDGLAIAMTIAAALVAPLGLRLTGSALWAPGALWRGATVAVLSSVLPYSLELIALRRLAAHVFGILLSLEPAVAALAGLLVLGQKLNPGQLLGMALVVAASGLVMGRRSVPSTPEALAETTNQ